MEIDSKEIFQILQEENESSTLPFAHNQTKPTVSLLGLEKMLFNQCRSKVSNEEEDLNCFLDKIPKMFLQQGAQDALGHLDIYLAAEYFRPFLICTKKILSLRKFYRFRFLPYNPWDRLSLR